jgi:hypothetical protein
MACVSSSVSNLNADPDPAIGLDADPDPANDHKANPQINADPDQAYRFDVDPDFYLIRMRTQVTKMMRVRTHTTDSLMNSRCTIQISLQYVSHKTSANRCES